VRAHILEQTPEQVEWHAFDACAVATPGSRTKKRGYLNGISPRQRCIQAIAHLLGY